MKNLISGLDALDLGSISTKSRIISLYDQVDAVSVSQVISEIQQINEEDDQAEAHFRAEYPTLGEMPRRPITLDLNSVGGSVYDGLALVAVIEQSKTPVITRVNGYAFSMGFILFLAGKERHMSRHANLMYHQISSIFYGKLRDVEDDVEVTKELQKQLEDYVLERTTYTRDELKKIYRLKRDVYIRPTEALEKSVATKIV